MKYKLKKLIKGNILAFNFPARKILSFKRTKWKFLKRKIKSLLRRRTRKFYPFKAGIPYKKWVKKKKIYREALIIKRSLVNFFGNSNTLTFNILKRKRLLTESIAKPFYYLNILLWKLSFFLSAKEAASFINNKNVLINEIVVKKNKMLKKGDRIQLINYKKVRKNNSAKGIVLFSFCEVDFYTNTIIILKDWSKLSRMDLSLIFKQKVNQKYLKYYINKN